MSVHLSGAGGGVGGAGGVGGTPPPAPGSSPISLDEPIKPPKGVPPAEFFELAVQKEEHKAIPESWFPRGIPEREKDEYSRKVLLSLDAARKCLNGNLDYLKQIEIEPGALEQRKGTAVGKPANFFSQQMTWTLKEPAPGIQVQFTVDTRIEIPPTEKDVFELSEARKKLRSAQRSPWNKLSKVISGSDEPVKNAGGPHSSQIHCLYESES